MLCKSDHPCQNDTPCQSDAPCHFVAMPNRHTVSFCRCAKVTIRSKVTHRVDLTTVSFCRCAILTRSSKRPLEENLSNFKIYFDFKKLCIKVYTLIYLFQLFKVCTLTVLYIFQSYINYFIKLKLIQSNYFLLISDT